MTVVSTIVYGFCSACLLVTAAGAQGSTVPTSSPTTTSRPCAIPSSVYNVGAAGYDPCAPFSTARIGLLSVVPNDAFGHDNRVLSVETLENGAVIVATTLGGLYRINRNRISILWPSYEDCYGHTGDPIDMIGAFDSVVILHDQWTGSLRGVRSDGSVSFQWRSSGAFVSHYKPGFLGSDLDGILWLERGENTETAFYAYAPQAQTDTMLGPIANVMAGFRSPNGRIYFSTGSRLFELSSKPPRAQAQFVRESLPTPAQPTGQTGSDTSFGPVTPINGVGPDGSLWATTKTQIIHVHPNGLAITTRLVPPFTWQHMPIPRLGMTMAPDGSVWMMRGKRIVRVSNDDRVQVADAPNGITWASKPAFARDGSIWALSTRPDTGQVVALIHFAFGDSAKVPAGPIARMAGVNAPPTPCPSPRLPTPR